MKHLSKHSIVLAASTLLIGLGSLCSASAGPSLTVRIGDQPPPARQRDVQWERPHRTAVWIPGHNEWRNRRYIWVGGYYSYPPEGQSRWESPQYSRRSDGYYYRPGRWTH